MWKIFSLCFKAFCFDEDLVAISLLHNSYYWSILTIQVLWLVIPKTYHPYLGTRTPGSRWNQMELSEWRKSGIMRNLDGRKRLTSGWSSPTVGVEVSYSCLVIIFKKNLLQDLTISYVTTVKKSVEIIHNKNYIWFFKHKAFQPVS